MAHDPRSCPLPTSRSERNLIAAARSGDAGAHVRLLKLYEPLVRHVAHRYYAPGADSEDLAQEARLAVIDAASSWDPRRRVPFSSFAWMCATREVRTAVQSAHAQKHRVLSTATPIEFSGWRRPVEVEDRTSQEFTRKNDGESLVRAELVGSIDHDPVAKTLAREQLQLIVHRGRRLSSLERSALALATTDHSYEEIAETLAVGTRAVNNALQRARGKLREPVAA